MDFRESDAEQLFINKEHIDAADNAAKIGERKSVFDKHDYSDSYYKNPENNKSRMFENIRQMSQVISGITDCIPDFLQHGTYELDVEGKGKIYQHTKIIEKMANLSGFYINEFSSGKPSKELDELFDRAQEVIDSFQQQIKKVISKEGEMSFELRSNIEPFVSIIKEPRDSLVSDLEEKYGKGYVIYSDMTEWVFYKRSFDLKAVSEKKARMLKSNEDREYYQQQREKILSTAAVARRHSLESTNSIDPKKSLAILLSIQHDNFGDFDVRTNPDLEGIITTYDLDKKSIYGKLRKHFLSHPEELEELEYEGLEFVLRKDLKEENRNLNNAFVETASPDKLEDFIRDQLSFPTVNLSYFFNLEISENDTSRLEEKKGKIGNVALEKFASSTFKNYGFEQNWSIISYLSGYFRYIKQTKPQDLQQIISQMVDSIPGSIFFTINHKQQMHQFSGFLEYVFLEMLSKEDVDEDLVRQLSSKLESHDNRYPEVNKSFDALSNKIAKRFLTIQNDKSSSN
jgi:hypothetical protein